MPARRSGVVVALVAAAALGLGACSEDGSGARSDPLGRYTDPDDGCPQVVSAISYTDAVLKPLGQEVYQTYTDDVRSRLSAIDGTVALEVKDFPSDEVLDLARTTGKEAARAAAFRATRKQRTRALRQYRRDAASLVLLCAPYVDPRPTANATGS